MEKLPITNEQYDTVVIRFTDYLVSLLKIKTEKGYLKEMRRLQKVIGYASPPNSLLGGGMRVTKKPLQTRTRIRKKTITMRRVMQDRIDRQSRRLMFNVMGHRINAETITAVLSTAFAACVASVFGGILSPLYPTAIFVVLAGYHVVEPKHYDIAMRDVAWIQVFLREMDRIEALPPSVQLHQFTPAHQQYMVRHRSQMNISPLALSRPSLFPTYVRYTEIMQSMLRASMTRPDGGGDRQRLCILGMAGLAGIAARNFLQPRLVELGVAQSVGDRVRRGTVRQFLRAIDSEKAFDKDSTIALDHMKSKRKLHFYHSDDAADDDDDDASMLP
jgi:hypothetical protein